MIIRQLKKRSELNIEGKKHVIEVRGLPEDAPDWSLNETWYEDEEHPSIEGKSLPEIAGILADRIKSYVVDTSRDRREQVVEYLRNNRDLDFDVEYMEE